MKRLYVLIAFLVPAAVYAQSTNDIPAHVSAERTNVLNLQALALPQTPETTFILRQPKPNEVFKGNVTLSGIGVELAKTRHPLQLLNPFAPSDYGSSEDNVVRDPINGRSSGLKFFAIKF
jgi:hypothetical protein